MSIILRHFDTKTKQDTEIAEELKNTLAEYLYPATQFAIGTAYPEATVAADLQPQIVQLDDEGTGVEMHLQFSSGSRMFFADHPDVRDQLYPVKSDGAPYGSLVFTACRSFEELKKVRVLVVDDTTGENVKVAGADGKERDLIDREIAKRLVGDCKGMCTPQVAQKLGIEPHRRQKVMEGGAMEIGQRHNGTFQYRLGVRSQAESPVARIAKGTLEIDDFKGRLAEVPIKVYRTDDGKLANKAGYDLVLPTSSFKGRKQEEHGVLKPGEYLWDVGVGVKSVGEYRQYSLGPQVLVNYPKAIASGLLPILKEQAEDLVQMGKSASERLIHIAQRYCEKYEKRKGIQAQLAAAGQEVEKDLKAFNDLFDSVLAAAGDEVEEPGNQKDLLAYRLIKADLAGYGQLLSHPRIINELEEFQRKEKLEIATGTSVKIMSGLAQPNLDLKSELGEAQVCIPGVPAGSQVILTRSPLVNANGVCLATAVELPNAKQGCVYLHPGYALDNFQCDFDGDNMAFAYLQPELVRYFAENPQERDDMPASDGYQNFVGVLGEVRGQEYAESLTPKEVREIFNYSKFLAVWQEEVRAHHEHNRYPDVVKKAKIPYHGSFEEIACSAMENKIGLIANEIMKNVALQTEIDNLPESEQVNYLKKLADHCRQLDVTNAPEAMLAKIQAVAEFTNFQKDEASAQKVREGLQLFKNLLRDGVAQLGNELQVAVDGPKSALRPDDTVFEFCRSIDNYKQIYALNDRKSRDVFTNGRGMRTNGYSALDLMAKQANEIFGDQQNQLPVRPIEQFKDFYSGVDTENQSQAAAEMITTYNNLVAERRALENRQSFEPGPYMVVTSQSSGKSVEITNLIQFEPAKDPNFWKSEDLTIRFYARTPKKDMPQTLEARAVFVEHDGTETETAVGTVGLKSTQEHSIQPGQKISQGKVEFHFGVSECSIDAVKQRSKDWLEAVRANTPEREKLQMAAAIHRIAHGSNQKQGEKRDDTPVIKKSGGAAFAIFTEQVVTQLDTLQFACTRALGTNFNDHAGRQFQGEKVSVRFQQGPDPKDAAKSADWLVVEDKKLGTLNANSGRLLPGTSAMATITSAPSTSAVITSVNHPDNQLQVNNTQNYAFAGQDWQGEQAAIALDLRQTNPIKSPQVYAKVGHKILGVLSKESADFIRERLDKAGKQVQGFVLQGTISRGASTYADIVIDPDTVKLPRSLQIAGLEKSTILEQAAKSDESVSLTSSNVRSPQMTTVVFFEPPLDPTIESTARRTMARMLERAVDRAVERGSDTIHFIDASLYKSEEPGGAAATVKQMQANRLDIKVQLSSAESATGAIAQLKDPHDIAIAIDSIETAGAIDYAARHGKPVLVYNPMGPQKFEKLGHWPERSTRGKVVPFPMREQPRVTDIER